VLLLQTTQRSGQRSAELRDRDRRRRPDDLAVGRPGAVRDPIAHARHWGPLDVRKFGFEGRVSCQCRLDRLAQDDDLVQDGIADRGISVERLVAASGVRRDGVSRVDHVSQALEGRTAALSH